jgi:ABC-2 type transport system ATP-binding protein
MAASNISGISSSLAPTAQRRGQDDYGADPDHAPRPEAGRARVAGLDVVRDRRRVRRRIALTGQYAAVDELQTGEENLRMVARLSGLSGKNARRRAGELLERFDLTDAGRRRTATYSGGMRRRLDLAASLVADPAVIFLDEPTTGLDLRSR